MFGLLPGGSPQEMFISPLENVLSMDSQNQYGSLTPTNSYVRIPTRTPLFPCRFTCAFELFPAIARIASPSPAAATTCVGDSGSAGAGKEYHGESRYQHGHVHSRTCQLRHPSGYGLSYVVPEDAPLSFDISEHMFTNALQEHQQQHQAHMPIAAPVAVPVDNRACSRRRASLSRVFHYPS